DYMESYSIDNQLDVQARCYDPYAIHGVLAEVERRGWQDELYEIRQGHQTLSNPISDFRLEAINGNIKHEKNPSLDIAVKNAIAKNVNDSLMIEKQMNREKIDPLMSSIFAYVIACEHQWDSETIMPLFI